LLVYLPCSPPLPQSGACRPSHRAIKHWSLLQGRWP
jgi:hypothetical protein